MIYWIIAKVCWKLQDFPFPVVGILFGRLASYCAYRTVDPKILKGWRKENELRYENSINHETW